MVGTSHAETAVEGHGHTAMAGIDKFRSAGKRPAGELGG